MCLSAWIPVAWRSWTSELNRLPASLGEVHRADVPLQGSVRFPFFLSVYRRRAPVIHPFDAERTLWLKSSAIFSEQLQSPGY